MKTFLPCFVSLFTLFLECAGGSYEMRTDDIKQRIFGGKPLEIANLTIVNGTPFAIDIISPRGGIMTLGVGRRIGLTFSKDLWRSIDRGNHEVAFVARVNGGVVDGVMVQTANRVWYFQEMNNNPEQIWVVEMQGNYLYFK